MSSETIRGRHLCEEVKREYGNDKKDAYFVDGILAVPVANIVIVNIELTKIKLTGVINLKWRNRDYPCYPVGTLRGRSPRANYTDRAAAAGRRS
jgi:hypothetical protein